MWYTINMYFELNGKVLNSNKYTAVTSAKCKERNYYLCAE